MKLNKLIADLPCIVYGKIKSIDVSGISYDSRVTAPGNIFVAHKGTQLDGNNFIQDALDNGAIAILSDQYNPFFTNTVQMVTDNIIECKSALVIKFYGDPSRHLHVMGVTGTNGKTTVSYMLKHCADMLGEPCGLISTIEYLVGNHIFEGKNTTPDIITSQKLMKEMLKYGCKHVAMEVSSFGIMQGRIKGCNIDAAIFTNLCSEHLDVHGTMENYAQEKRKLFINLTPLQWAIFNKDCPWTEIVREGCQARTFFYGLDPSADLYATDILQDGPNLFFNIVYQREIVPFHCRLIGVHNIYNVMAALSVCVKILKAPLKQLSEIFHKFVAPSGRLEAIDGGPCSIFIDYAHTPGALKIVLTALRNALDDKGRLIIVFGCGGDRDYFKRPLMGAIAEQLADFIILTSDNPRSEEPEAILRDIQQGFLNHEKHVVEPDRAIAIEVALKWAKKEDIILIAGKGHEKIQEFKRTSYPYNDKMVVNQLISHLQVGNLL
ncbi:UDP-N-acetylmuramoyl-L-alanyl-D-glutamate--2,6-diaminopimelate ligase [Candidatus Clavichlamydia salmonicola]|uniref:UDP-N-acetylmuramoyl-L-alanyl-D-glutamate--2, 6-diaminopimelate ligase n=1 Tax=Candidatus Clavichlamydia salmonicola TaxID=469812 RepID=UPI001890F1F4|nr:UDP-N-acetylmuramoyl-L-alanyl-D-glutamate--2,6-diaminopimelate ligase [Candidatus Clavichlamydia salmonicola]